MNYWGLSDQGRIRENNEDSFSVTRNTVDNILCVVCDGIGGAKNGEWASNLLSWEMAENFRETGAFNGVNAAKRWLRNQIQLINQEIYQQSLLNANCKGMGTTLVCCLVYKTGIVIACSGDSRCYGYNSQGLTQITKDHTLVNSLVEKGELTPAQAAKHPGRHILSRAIGVDKTAKIDFFNLPLADMTLLFCSDGLHGMISDSSINNVLKRKINGEKKVKELVEIANNQGGYDNITVVLLEG